jgi:hypothetical protein
VNLTLVTWDECPLPITASDAFFRLGYLRILTYDESSPVANKKYFV